MLLTYGCEIGLTNPLGRTAADVATEAAASLIAKASNKKPLHIAAEVCGDARAIRWWLETGRACPGGPAEAKMSCGILESSIVAGLRADGKFKAAALVADAGKPWAPQIHSLYHAGFRRAVHAVLLCSYRLRAKAESASDSDGSLDQEHPTLPREMWLAVLGFSMRWHVSRQSPPLLPLPAS